MNGKNEGLWSVGIVDGFVSGAETLNFKPRALFRLVAKLCDSSALRFGCVFSGCSQHESGVVG